MNRRNFIASLGALAVVCGVAPDALAKSFEQNHGPIPPYVKQGKRWILNSEWLTASHEIGFVFRPPNKLDAILGKKFLTRDNPAMIRDPFPFRFRTAEDGYAFIQHQVS